MIIVVFSRELTEKGQLIYIETLDVRLMDSCMCDIEGRKGNGSKGNNLVDECVYSITSSHDTVEGLNSDDEEWNV